MKYPRTLKAGRSQTAMLPCTNDGFNTFCLVPLESPRIRWFCARRCLTASVAATSIARDSNCHLEKQDSHLPVGAEVYERTSTGTSGLLQVRPEGRRTPDVQTFRCSEGRRRGRLAKNASTLGGT